MGSGLCYYKDIKGITKKIMHCPNGAMQDVIL